MAARTGREIKKMEIITLTLSYVVPTLIAIAALRS
jgi:hypothetical protein